MAGNAERTRAAIAPGSTPFGDRGMLEQAIGQSQQLAASPEAGAGAVGGMAPISPQDPFSDPMSALMGQGGFSSERPVTSGLSVGPGDSPPPVPTDLPIPLMSQLQNIALNAKSPQLRGAAVLALRRIVRNRGR